MDNYYTVIYREKFNFGPGPLAKFVLPIIITLSIKKEPEKIGSYAPTKGKREKETEKRRQKRKREGK